MSELERGSESRSESVSESKRGLSCFGGSPSLRVDGRVSAMLTSALSLTAGRR